MKKIKEFYFILKETYKKFYNDKSISYNFYNTVNEKYLESKNKYNNLLQTLSNLRKIKEDLEDSDIKTIIRDLNLYLSIGIAKNNITGNSLREKYYTDMNFYLKLKNEIKLELKKHNYKKIIELKNKYEM
jgi:hypothetical protein